MAGGRVFRRKVNGVLQDTWSVQYDAPITNGSTKKNRNQKMKGGFKNKAEARAFLVAKQHEINTGSYLEVSKMTVAQFLQFFYEEYVIDKNSPTTQMNRRSQINIISESSIGSIKISNLQPLEVEGFYKELKKRGLKGSAIKCYHGLLRTAFRFAVRKQLISNDPTLFVDPPEVDESPVTYLEPDHVKLVLKKLSESKHYDIFLFALYSGLRIGEVCGLRFKDVDFEQCELTVNQIAQRITGEGVKIKNSPKTKSSRRTISLSKTEMEILKRAKMRVAKNKLKFGELYEDKDLVFAKGGGKPTDPQRASRVFTETIRSLGLDEKGYTLHSLRHTMATFYLEETKDLKLTQERLGHKNASTTINTYLHVMKDKNKAAAEQVGEFISKIALAE